MGGPGKREKKTGGNTPANRNTLEPGRGRQYHQTEADDTMELDRRQVAWIEERIARAAEKAKEQKAPLTVERMAAELGIDVHTFRAYLAPDYLPPTKHAALVMQALRDASAQATASVLEHALGRGSGQNMHLLYLKQYAGFGIPEGAGEDGTQTDPVIFFGEDELC